MKFIKKLFNKIKKEEWVNISVLTINLNKELIPPRKPEIDPKDLSCIYSQVCTNALRK